MTDSLEVITQAYAAEYYHLKGRPINQAWLGAKRDQIERAMGRVSEYLRAEANRYLSCDDPSHIEAFVAIVADYEPSGFAGSLVGLADRSLKNIKREKAQRRRQLIEKFGRDTKLQAPLFGFPNVEGITFISTVGELEREGEGMGNCVVDFTEEAIKGEYYFFHIEKRGQHATARIARDGRILDIDGKGHKENYASTWGAFVFLDWGARI
jgi:hypothetical protein